MTRRYPTINPKYQSFLAEKDEKEVKISSPITPKEGPTPPPMGELLLSTVKPVLSGHPLLSEQ